MLSFRVDDHEAADAQIWASGSASIGPNCCARPFVATSFAWQARTMRSPGPSTRSTRASKRWPTSLIGALPRTGRTGRMQRGEIWFAATPGGDRPVLVLTRDPVADRIGAVVVAALTRARRHLVSELELTPADDGVPTECVVNFDNIHTLARDSFRRQIATLSPARMMRACLTLQAATGC